MLVSAIHVEIWVNKSLFCSKIKVVFRSWLTVGQFPQFSSPVVLQLKEIVASMLVPRFAIAKSYTRSLFNARDGGNLRPWQRKELVKRKNIDDYDTEESDRD